VEDTHTFLLSSLVIGLAGTCAKREKFLAVVSRIFFPLFLLNRAATFFLVRQYKGDCVPVAVKRLFPPPYIGCRFLPGTSPSLIFINRQRSVVFSPPSLFLSESIFCLCARAFAVQARPPVFVCASSPGCDSLSTAAKSAASVSFCQCLFSVKARFGNCSPLSFPVMFPPLLCVDKVVLFTLPFYARILILLLDCSLFQVVPSGKPFLLSFRPLS